jgi:hypothetical protein
VSAEAGNVTGVSVGEPPVAGGSVGEAVGLAVASSAGAASVGETSVGAVSEVVSVSIEGSASVVDAVEEEASAGIGEVFKLAYTLAAYFVALRAVAQALVAADELSIG